MNTDEELPLLGVVAGTPKCNTPLDGEIFFSPPTRVVKNCLLMSHSNADSELALSMAKKVDTEHRSEMAQDTIAARLLVNVN